MTPHHVFTVAVIGGLTALTGLIVLALLLTALYPVASHIYDAYQDHRERRRTLTDYRRRLDTLPTTSEHDRRPPRSTAP